MPTYEFLRHSRYRMLCDLLKGEAHYTAIGGSLLYLESALSNGEAGIRAMGGELDGIEPEDLERLAGWIGRERFFYAALVACGLIYSTPSAIFLRGWPNAAPEYVRKKLRAAKSRGKFDPIPRDESDDEFHNGNLQDAHRCARVRTDVIELAEFLRTEAHRSARMRTDAHARAPRDRVGEKITYTSNSPYTKDSLNSQVISENKDRKIIHPEKSNESEEKDFDSSVGAEDTLNGLRPTRPADAGGIEDAAPSAAKGEDPPEENFGLNEKLWTKLNAAGITKKSWGALPDRYRVSEILAIMGADVSFRAAIARQADSDRAILAAVLRTFVKFAARPNAPKNPGGWVREVLHNDGVKLGTLPVGRKSIGAAVARLMGNQEEKRA